MSKFPPPQPGPSATQKKVRLLTGVGGVLTILGAIQVAGACLLWGWFAVSNPDDGRWVAQLAVQLNLLIGLPLLATGLVLSFSNQARQQRSVSTGGRAVFAPAKKNIVIPVLGIALIPLGVIGFGFSLYGYIGNESGTNARRLGLIGLFLNLGFHLLLQLLSR